MTKSTSSEAAEMQARKKDLWRDDQRVCRLVSGRDFDRPGCLGCSSSGQKDTQQVVAWMLHTSI